MNLDTRNAVFRGLWSGKDQTSLLNVFTRRGKKCLTKSNYFRYFSIIYSYGYIKEPPH